MDEIPQAKASNNTGEQIQELRTLLNRLLHPTEGLYAKIQEVKAETEVANLRLISTVDMVELRLTEHRKYLSDIIDNMQEQVKDTDKNTDDAKERLGVLETKIEQLSEAKKARRGFIYGIIVAVTLWFTEAILGPLKALWELLFTTSQ